MKKFNKENYDGIFHIGETLKDLLGNEYIIIEVTKDDYVVEAVNHENNKNEVNNIMENEEMTFEEVLAAAKIEYAELAKDIDEFVGSLKELCEELDGDNLDEEEGFFDYDGKNMNVTVFDKSDRFALSDMVTIYGKDFTYKDYVICPECHNWVPEEETKEINGKVVCLDCYKKFMEEHKMNLEILKVEENEGDYSVLVHDKALKDIDIEHDYSYWIDVSIEEKYHDVEVDWNQYIFMQDNPIDVAREEFQNNSENFEAYSDSAVNYLETKGYIGQLDNGDWIDIIAKKKRAIEKIKKEFENFKTTTIEKGVDFVFKSAYEINSKEQIIGTIEDYESNNLSVTDYEHIEDYKGNFIEDIYAYFCGSDEEPDIHSFGSTSEFIKEFINYEINEKEGI